MQVFFPVNQKKIEGYDIKTLTGRRPVKGDIGLEVECEGNKFQKSSEFLSPFWVHHVDHSLRGKDNAEYVLANPIDFDTVPTAVMFLWDMFESYGTKLDESNRTSVHVHLNVQKWNLNRLASFCAMFFALEEILSEWAGDHRVGNLFCLRGKDAPAIITKLKKFIKFDGSYELTDGLHYAGLNIQALQKFGSLEVRYLRGATNPQLILDWVAILRRLYEQSALYPDPRDVLSLFSYEGPLNFFDTILGDTKDIVLAGLSVPQWDREAISQSLYEGIRLSQDLIYCRDWDLYQPVVMPDDPFGRSTKKKSDSSLNNFLNSGLSPSQISTIMGTMGNASADVFAGAIYIPSPPLPAPAPETYTGLTLPPVHEWELNINPSMPSEIEPEEDLEEFDEEENDYTPEEDIYDSDEGN